MNTISFLAFGGALELIMIPFRTLATNILVSDLEKMLPFDEFTPVHNAFCLLLGATKDVVLRNENHVEASAIADFFHTTKGFTTLEKWDVFQFALSQNGLNEWWNAYTDTRQKSPMPAPEILQTGKPTDPNG